MSENPTLYMNILSPPCCAVLMTGAELGVEFDLKVIDLNGLDKNVDFVKVRNTLNLFFNTFKKNPLSYDNLYR